MTRAATDHFDGRTFVNQTGACEPRWFMQPVHMNPAEAVQAHLDLQPAASIAMHFGTFQLTTEGIDEPLRALAAACRERGLAPPQVRAPRFRRIGACGSLRSGRSGPASDDARRLAVRVRAAWLRRCLSARRSVTARPV